MTESLMESTGIHLLLTAQQLPHSPTSSPQHRSTSYAKRCHSMRVSFVYAMAFPVALLRIKSTTYLISIFVDDDNNNTKFRKSKLFILRFYACTRRRWCCNALICWYLARFAPFKRINDFLYTWYDEPGFVIFIVSSWHRKFSKRNGQKCRWCRWWCVKSVQLRCRNADVQCDGDVSSTHDDMSIMKLIVDVCKMYVPIITSRKILSIGTVEMRMSCSSQWRKKN